MTLLADRGFEHGELNRWLQRNNWSWAIRVKCDLQVTLSTGMSWSVEQLLPPSEQAYLFQNVTVLGNIACHLATAKVPTANEAWALLSDRPPSLQTFALYGKRIGGIEPHRLDWHAQRGLSFLQLGLRELQRLCYQGQPLPSLEAIPRQSPPAACASRRKREQLECRIEFSRVTTFSS